MTTAKIGNHTIELFDSIDSLPVLRYHAFNKMLLIDAGVGSDLSDIDRRIERTARYIKAEEKENAIAEMQNLRQCLYLVLSGLNTEHLAFACLVKSVDGHPCDDLTTEGLKATLDKLAPATKKEISDSLAESKKKIDEEMRMYFPALYDDAETKTYHDKLLRRTLKALDALIDGEDPDTRDDVNTLTGELLTAERPRNFAGKDSAEIEYDKRFEDMCLVMSKELHIKPKTMTVMEYYNAFEFIKSMSKQHKNKRK